MRLNMTRVLLALVLIVGGGNLLATYLQVRTVARNSATITQLHAANVAACGLGNEGLARQVTLWDHLIAISKPPAGASAAVRRQDAAVLAGLRAYIGRVFAPRNCQALYRL